MLALCVYMVDCTGELGGPLGSSRARFQADKVCGIRSQHTLAQYGMFGSIRAVGIITTRLSTLEYKVITGRKLFSDQDPPTRVTERLKKRVQFAGFWAGWPKEGSAGKLRPGTRFSLAQQMFCERGNK